MIRGLFASLLLAALVMGVCAAQSAASTVETKTGYLLNFAEFVEWPADAFTDAKAPFVVGVMGKDDPFGAELDKLEGKIVNGRRLEIRRFKGVLEFRGQETPGRRQESLRRRQEQKLEFMKSCHILFVSRAEKKFWSQIFKSLNSASVLTVGETDTFVQEGGMISFLDGEKKPHIAINLAAARRARLKISSKLLSLAKVIGAETGDDQR